MSTGDCIAFYAAERPEALALVNGQRAISYAEFNCDIGKFTAALREFGLPRGSTVAVGCDDFYTHWLLLLAFERLNVATASFDKMESPAAYREFLAGVDLVLSEGHFSIAGATRHHPITEAWVRETLARDNENGQACVQEAPGDDVVRILRTSGTTGRPKRVALTRHMYELRIVRYAERYQFTRKSRYLLSMSFAVGHTYSSATACLRVGGTVVNVVTERGSGGVFAEFGITHVSLQPLTLKQILDGLPPDFVKPADLTIGTFGSPMSDELSGRALRQLATEVTDCFGCNEVGGISFKRATLRDTFAAVYPGVEVEAIDESGRPVPSGEPGRLRIRSESMVQGYLDDPETTRRYFKDGWFYPNDVAILDGPRRIKVIGRDDELVNIAGGKLAPSDLEALVMKHAGVGDVGICTFPDREGIQEVYVAVAGVRQDRRELLARITSAFSVLALGRFHIVMVSAIPRNALGKIQRAKLKEAVAAAARLNQS
jgi:2,3-dihydroxybenzoate-AMP ligase